MLDSWVVFMKPTSADVGGGKVITRKEDGEGYTVAAESSHAYTYDHYQTPIPDLGVLFHLLERTRGTNISLCFSHSKYGDVKNSRRLKFREEDQSGIYRILPNRLFPVDIDVAAIPSWIDRRKPEYVARYIRDFLLPEYFKDKECVWQATSSFGLGRHIKASIRLFFLNETPVHPWKVRAHVRGVGDPAIYEVASEIFIAEPRYQGAGRPPYTGERFGYILGSKLNLPDIEFEKNARERLDINVGDLPDLPMDLDEAATKLGWTYSDRKWLSLVSFQIDGINNSVQRAAGGLIATLGTSEKTAKDVTAMLIKAVEAVEGRSADVIQERVRAVPAQVARVVASELQTRGAHDRIVLKPKRPDAVEVIYLEDARAELRKVIEENFGKFLPMAAANRQLVLDGGSALARKPYAIYAAPGAGKTHRLMEKIGEMVRQDPRFRVLVLQPTHKLIQESIEKLGEGVDYFVWKGAEQPIVEGGEEKMCHYAERLPLMRSIGLRQAEMCKGCDRNPVLGGSCPFRLQDARDFPVVFHAGDLTGRAPTTPLKRRGRLSDLPFDLVVKDEFSPFEFVDSDAIPMNLLSTSIRDKYALLHSHGINENHIVHVETLVDRLFKVLAAAKREKTGVSIEALLKNGISRRDMNKALLYLRGMYIKPVMEEVRQGLVEDAKPYMEVNRRVNAYKVLMAAILDYWDVIGGFQEKKFPMITFSTRVTAEGSKQYVHVTKRWEIHAAFKTVPIVVATGTPSEEVMKKVYNDPYILGDIKVSENSDAIKRYLIEDFTGSMEECSVGQYTGKRSNLLTQTANMKRTLTVGGVGMLSMTGIVTFKNNVAYRNNVYSHMNFMTGKEMYYGNLRGSNMLAGVRTLIELGKPRPPSETVIATGAVLARDKDLEMGDGSYEPARADVKMRDKTVVPVKSVAHPHPVVDEVRRAGMEDESEQAQQRARLIERGVSNPCHVLRIHNGVPEYPVDATLKKADFDVAGGWLGDMLSRFRFMPVGYGATRVLTRAKNVMPYLWNFYVMWGQTEKWPDALRSVPGDVYPFDPLLTIVWIWTVFGGHNKDGAASDEFMTFVVGLCDVFEIEGEDKRNLVSWSLDAPVLEALDWIRENVPHVPVNWGVINKVNPKANRNERGRLLLEWCKNSVERHEKKGLLNTEILLAEGGILGNSSNSKLAEKTQKTAFDTQKTAIQQKPLIVAKKTFFEYTPTFFRCKMNPYTLLKNLFTRSKGGFNVSHPKYSMSAKNVEKIYKILAALTGSHPKKPVTQKQFSKAFWQQTSSKEIALLRAVDFAVLQVLDGNVGTFEYMKMPLVIRPENTAVRYRIYMPPESGKKKKSKVDIVVLRWPLDEEIPPVIEMGLRLLCGIDWELEVVDPMKKDKGKT